MDGIWWYRSSIWKGGCLDCFIKEGLVSGGYFGSARLNIFNQKEYVF